MTNITGITNEMVQNAPNCSDDETELRILQLFKQLDRIQQENVIARAELLAEQNEAEYNDKENVS